MDRQQKGNAQNLDEVLTHIDEAISTLEGIE